MDGSNSSCRRMIQGCAKVSPFFVLKKDSQQVQQTLIDHEAPTNQEMPPLWPKPGIGQDTAPPLQLRKTLLNRPENHLWRD